MRCEYTLHGTNVNLAARLMVAAKKGVLVDYDTWIETNNKIDYDSPQTIKVKGKKEEIHVYRPKGEKMHQIVHVKGQEISLYGRTNETKLISEKFDSLLSENAVGGTMLFTGGLGMGKSRMCSFISAFSADRSVFLVEGSGLDTEISTPYFPWRSVFAQLCGFETEVTDAGKIKKLKQFIPEKLVDIFPLFGKLHAYY